MYPRAVEICLESLSSSLLILLGSRGTMLAAVGLQLCAVWFVLGTMSVALHGLASPVEGHGKAWCCKSWCLA